NEVFIVRARGLPWSCTVEDIQNFFSECRIRDGLKGIHRTLTRDGKPSGEAFIELEHEEDVRKALEKHRQYLGPRYVEVYEVTNDDAEAFLQKSVPPPSDGVVRLRGLPYGCSEEDVVQFFEGLNVVPNGVTLVADRRGRPSGEAYVEFVSQDVADQALQKDRGIMGKRYIEVFQSRRSEIRARYGSHQRKVDFQPLAVDSAPSFAPRSFEDVSDSHSHYENGPGMNSAGFTVSQSESKMDSSLNLQVHCIHMRGLPFHVTGVDIANFFTPFKLQKILIEYGPEGKASGEADVYFDTHEDAVSAMSKDKMHIQHRYIELFLNSPSQGEEKVG
ncbi:GRSF1 factor, partial [Amia calva]|nr:GRSF1 factor [Amia calva]